MYRHFMHIAFGIAIFSLNACTSNISLDNRKNLAHSLAEKGNWYRISLPTQEFTIASFIPQKTLQSDVLTIYIEGDGMAWINRRTPSQNPTPRSPVALKLALQHPISNVAYLARPCQYILDDNCTQSDWTNGRFSKKVVNSLNTAVSLLKQRFHAKNLTLVGYSGGGALAYLVASRRNDIEKIITVAGNMDHVEWTKYHNVSPLLKSLNPADHINIAASFKQVHLVGENDKIVPSSLITSFIQKQPSSQETVLFTYPEFDHACCWVKNWGKIWNSISK
ncbi:dienelactone hydrolase family protein [Kiloniella litopenaei]|uniref:dienelactone hydrolase family protein n=1 Tax=Kiloniella litopenaei TaxID=1549748 RepID=UPI003BAAA0E8